MEDKNLKKIALITKKGKPYTNEVFKFLNEKFEQVRWFEGSRIDSFPETLKDQQFDLIISYLSPWIIPDSVLSKTTYWNINFHPGSPDHRGMGNYNFALYNNDTAFGVTAHIMTKDIDQGKIIGVKRFEILTDDTVQTLIEKSYSALYHLFKEVMLHIINNTSLPSTDESWSKELSTIKKLENLCHLETGISKDELERIIRATYLEGFPGPYVELHGYKFHLDLKR